MEGLELLRRSSGPAKRLPVVFTAFVFLTLFGIVAPIPPSTAWADDVECIQVIGDDGYMRTICRSSSNGGEDGGDGNGDPNAPTPYDYWSTPSCDGNVPPPETSAGTMCPRATQTCDVIGEEGIFTDYYVKMERDSPWTLQGTWCSGYIDDQFEPDVDPEQVAEEMAEHLLPDSNVRMSPENGRVLTTVPVIFYAEEDEFSDTATLLGVEVEVRARATEFQWNWGDDSSDTVTRPGIPYDGNIANPEYVKHPYNAKGSYTASLTTIWQGEFRIAGEEWQDLPEMTVDRGEAGDLTIVDQRNRLSD